MKKEIAFFDFDGTITTKDTLLEFIKFCRGGFRFYFGFLWNAPYLIAYKLNIISNQSAKEKILGFFFRNIPVDAFENYCNSFSKKLLPQLIRPKAIEEIKRLQQKNITVVVVSASSENWIKCWATEIGIELIASQLEVKGKKITGKLLGKNCHGDEKVRRIRDNYDLTKYEIIAAYGDSHGDKPMLELAKHSFYKCF